MNMKKIVGILGIAFLGSILGVVAFSLMVKPEVRYVQQPAEPEVKFATLPSGSLENADFRHAAQMSVDAVVHVTSTQILEQTQYGGMFDYFFNEPRNKEKRGYGSGVIISADGYIVTNNHVIKDADEIIIKLNDGTLLDAELVGTDPNSDVAVVKVKEKNLPFMVFGDSDELQLGDWVLAVGNPLSLNTTVTAGIVSAKARDIDIIGTTYQRLRNGRLRRIRDPNAIESFIQTDAAVNPGNSGGALVNLHGELVGINTAIASQTGAYSGYSFAIPSIIVQKVVNDIIEFGEVRRAALGVSIIQVDQELIENEKLDVNNGVFIKELTEDGGALHAGIKKGDVLMAINGRVVPTISQLQEQLMRYGPGEKVDVRIDRSGSSKTFTVELKGHDPNAMTVATAEFWNHLGAELENLSDEDLERMDITHGVKVKKVTGGIFGKKNIPEGFVITEVDRHKVSTKESIKGIIERKKEGGVFIEGILPNGRYEYFTFKK